MIRATQLENLGRNAASFWWLMGIGRMAVVPSGPGGGSILVHQASRTCQRRKPDAPGASTIRQSHQLKRLCCQYRCTAQTSNSSCPGSILGLSRQLSISRASRHVVMLLPVGQGCCCPARRGGDPLCFFCGIRSLRAASKKPTDHQSCAARWRARRAGRAPRCSPLCTAAIAETNQTRPRTQWSIE